MISYGLKDRTIAITGGASGIGRAAALMLARDGSNVGIIDVNGGNIDKVLAEIREHGAKASGFVADVRAAGQIRQAAERCEQERGAVIDINLKGAFLSCREFGRRMIERGRGSIVVISSVDGLGGHPGRTSYVSSKHAVNGLAKNLALEWGRHGVRVNAIAPGFVDTPLLRASMPAKFITGVVEDRMPLGRMAAPEEIASIALMLLSDAASYVTGAVVLIDGGLTAGYFTARRGGDYSSKKLLEAGIYSE